MFSKVCSDYIHLTPAQKMIKERPYNPSTPEVQMKTEGNLTLANQKVSASSSHAMSQLIVRYTYQEIVENVYHNYLDLKVM